jgi:hypothetical protein
MMRMCVAASHRRSPGHDDEAPVDGVREIR